MFEGRDDTGRGAGCPSGARVIQFDAMETIDARYEAGVLTPAHPLALRQGEWVRLIVQRRPDLSRWDLDRHRAAADDDADLADLGLEEWETALEKEDRQ